MSDIAKRAAMEYYRRSVVLHMQSHKVANATAAAYDSATEALRRAQINKNLCANEAREIGVSDKEMEIVDNEYIAIINQLDANS